MLVGVIAIRVGTIAVRIPARGRLDLQRRVFDAEVRGQRATHLASHGLLIAALSDDNVRRQRNTFRTERPDVEVVDLLSPTHVGKYAANRLEVDVRRYSIQKHMTRVP